jgi:hypothetical protein
MMNKRSTMTRLNELKNRLSLQFGFRYSGVLTERALRHAINEADALASTTAFPLLLFPVLAEEKVRKASRWQEKQMEIANRSMRLVA